MLEGKANVQCIYALLAFEGWSVKEFGEGTTENKKPPFCSRPSFGSHKTNKHTNCLVSYPKGIRRKHPKGASFAYSFRFREPLKENNNKIFFCFCRLNSFFLFLAFQVSIEKITQYLKINERPLLFHLSLLHSLDTQLIMKKILIKIRRLVKRLHLSLRV